MGVVKRATQKVSRVGHNRSYMEGILIAVETAWETSIQVGTREFGLYGVRSCGVVHGFAYEWWSSCSGRGLNKAPVKTSDEVHYTARIMINGVRILIPE